MKNSPSSPSVIIDGRGIEVRAGTKVLVTGIDISISDREVVTVIGPNGSGKTTLLRALLGLTTPTSGTVYRRPATTIGYMPQRLAVDRNLPMTVRRFLGLAGKFERGHRAEVLEETGIRHIIDSSIHDISGGEWQRALLARALLRDPDLLVLDEPVQAVDVTGQAELYKLISHIRDTRGCGVLMVSHDLHLVMAETDKVVCINTHLCCAGTPDVVSRDPKYVELFGRGVAERFALYHHHHDHEHAVDGHVIDEHEHDHEDAAHG